MHNSQDSPPYLIDPFLTTPHEVIDEKLKILALKDGDTLIDLGCGDARSLIAARKLKDITCIGYELRPEALTATTKNIQEENMSEQIKIISESFLNADVSNADALILYLTRYSLGELSLKLENELPIGARIVTHDFDIPAWEAEKVVHYKAKNAIPFTIYLYVKK